MASFNASTGESLTYFR